MVRPSRGLDDHIEMVVPYPEGNVITVSPIISTFVLNTLTLINDYFVNKDVNLLWEIQMSTAHLKQTIFIVGVDL